MSDFKDVGWIWMAKCNQLTTLPFEGLIYILYDNNMSKFY